MIDKFYLFSINFNRRFCEKCGSHERKIIYKTQGGHSLYNLTIAEMITVFIFKCLGLQSCMKRVGVKQELQHIRRVEDSGPGQGQSALCSRYHTLQNKNHFQSHSKMSIFMRTTKFLGIEATWKSCPLVLTSVADPGCLSPILIFVHPGSRISDPNSKKRGVKKICCPTFL